MSLVSLRLTGNELLNYLIQQLIQLINLTNLTKLIKLINLIQLIKLINLIYGNIKVIQPVAQ